MKTSKWKRSMALLLSLLMLCGMLPLSALAAGDSVGRVRVTVSNNTYPLSDGAAWDGDLVVNEWVDIDKDSTMMSCIVAALTKYGYTQTGAESNYISEIEGLAAFDGGAESGWMGTLNDWFTDTGFGDVSVAKGTLADGDEIAVMYTRNGYGADLGGTWENNDTTVKAVGFSAGTVSPAFDKDTHAYTLTLPAGTESVVVTPTASNKNYQVRTFVGETEYKRTASVPVTEGTVITVKCADPAWPTMNDKPEAAQVYTFTVAVAGEPAEPEITAQPQSTEIESGKKATLSVTATAPEGGELSYQWYQVSASGAEPVSGATAASYKVRLYDLGDTSFYCEVTNTVDGERYSVNTDTVTVTVYERYASTLAVYNAAGDRVFYQYGVRPGKEFEIELDPAETYTLRVLPVNPGMTSTYSMTLSYNGEAAEAVAYTTNAVALDVSRIAKSNGSFTVEMGTLDAATGAYVCSEVYNFKVTLLINNLPVITAQPRSTEIKYGARATLSVTATAPEGGELSYQWYKVGTAGAEAISGATEATYKERLYTLGVMSYYCEVTNTVDGEAYSVNTDTVTVTVYDEYVSAMTFVSNHYTFGSFTGNWKGGEFDVSLPDLDDYYLNVNTKQFAGSVSYSMIVSYNGVEGAVEPFNSKIYPDTEKLTQPGSFFTLEVGKYDEDSESFVSSEKYRFNVSWLPGIRNIVLTDSGKTIPVDVDFSQTMNASLTNAKSVEEAGNTPVVTVTPNRTTTQVYIGNSTAPSTKQAVALDEYELVYDGQELYAVIPIRLVGANGAEQSYTLMVMVAETRVKVTKQPQDVVCYTGDSVSLTVEAEALDGGVLSYQWYEKTGSEGRPIEGATAATYALVTETVGNTDYYCVITDTNGENVKSIRTNVISAAVKDSNDLTPVILSQPETRITCNQGDEPILSVEVLQPPKGELSYRWFQGGLTSTVVSEDKEFTPSTERNASHSYYCVITNTADGKEYTATTDKVTLKVNLTRSILEATITKQPGTYVYDSLTGEIPGGYIASAKANSIPSPFNVQFERQDFDVVSTATLYHSETNSYDDAVLVKNADIRGTRCGSGGGVWWDEYKIDPNTAYPTGEHYFFVVITLSPEDKNSTVEPVSTRSDILKIKFSDRVTSMDGIGTEESPYIISTAEQLSEIQTIVNDGDAFAGAYFRLGNDVTLPADWTPIGTKDTPFGGSIDGNGKLLTVPAGGMPLLGYVKNAAVKDLNIYGEQIEGAGLVNSYCGVGLSGSAIVIDNVTLKSGSKTLKSGLVAAGPGNGYASASMTFVITIRNCTIEENVVVGYSGDESQIGSIAARVNGTIENCVSYATVKGKSYVGGILGTRDNAMGQCEVINSAFHGAVEATGTYAGGIVGGGYDNSTAPNGACPSIIGCTVDGTVSGNVGVGGIFGGDGFVAQTWDNVVGSISNNTFTGKVSGEQYVGAIIGYRNSLNRYDTITDNTYSANCGTERGIGYVKYLDTSYPNPTVMDGTVAFNTESSIKDCPTVTGCAWKVAHNRTDDPLGADADKLCKVIEEPTVSYTVNLSPKTANASFFKGADAETALAETAVEDKGQVKVGSYTYHQYVLTVPAGVYSYRGNESGVALGGEPFTVPEEDGQSMNLLRVNVRYNGASLNQEGDYSFTLKNGESEVACGEPYLSSNIRYTPTLLIAGVAHTGTVTLNEKWEDEFYLTGTPAGSFTNTPSKTANSAATLNLPITAYKIIRVTAPKEATTTFYKQDANYVVESVTPDSSTENEDGTVTYMFKGTAAHSNYQFRSMLEGKVTQAGYLADGNNVTVSFPDRSPAGTASTLGYDDNGVLLNIPNAPGTMQGRNKLSLGVGDTFKLRAFRAPWEIINTTTGNQMIEPDFHFAVLSGEGVVSITPTDECSNSKYPNAKNGNATGNWMNVKAENPGTAVVAVWYDAIDVYNANPPAANAFSTFGATDPARYGIFVVTVGEDKNLSWNPVSADGDWDSEFDTVYYVGESGEFTFNPGAVGSVTVQNVYGAALGAVQSVSPNADGSYSVPVKTGANIICADGDYMVVRARQISYTVTNKTTGEAVTNGAPAIKTEDTVEISFSKLDIPLPKMSGIYNPGYMGTGKTAYVLNDTYTLTSAGTQYDFSVNNAITFKAHVAGENSLKGYISLSSMGDNFGNHRNINDDGKPVNTNAGEVFGSFGVLPDISFTVTDSGASGSYENATKITKFSVVAGLNTFTNAFNWNQAKDTEACWNKTAAQVSSYGLIPNVTTADYNNVITFRYWYEGEEVHSLQLISGVAGNITPADFPLNPAKLLHLQVEVKPIPETLGAPVVYNYLAFPGSGNLSYVHPFIKSLSATVGEETVALPINSVDTAYTLNVGAAKTITLNAVQLVQIYNTATTADCSDLVTLTKLCKGETVGESITILEKGQPNNPNRVWTLNDLDISGADALSITVTSYVDESVSRTYRIALEKEAEEEPVLLGDMNGDGEISALDAALVYNYVNEIVDLTEAQLKAADVDGNGEVTALDAALIYNYVNEVIDVFPAGK